MEIAIRELTVRLGRLADAMLRLRVTAIEDRPRPGGYVVRLAVRYDEAVEEALGLSEEAFEAAVEYQKAVERLTDPDRARRAISTCQQRYNALVKQFMAVVASDWELAHIARLGKEQGGGWTSWVENLKQAIEACMEPLIEVGRTITACWDEIRSVRGPHTTLTTGTLANGTFSSL